MLTGEFPGARVPLVPLVIACWLCFSQVLLAQMSEIEFFEKRIRPVLVERCYRCHSAAAESVKGGLLLDSRAGWLAGGESGAVIEPGKPAESLILEALRHDGLKMPPDGKLSDQQIADFQAWIAAGALDPRTEAAAGPRRAAIDFEKAGEFWSVRPLSDPPIPVVRDAGWPLTSMDCFVLARLEDEDFEPAPATSRRVWLRRVTFDLIGLPPTPQEVRAFLHDNAPDAFARVVDRLLASPHYGARWGRHWLDVVRYADTSGCNGDFPVPDAYRYRNYVIESFNRDKPFDQFVREQIAGDLLPAETDEQRYEQIVATGYLANSRRFSSLGEEFHLTLDDTIDNVGKAFLGLSISCARCHDHKFDPIPQEDYYALYGIFDSTMYAFPGTEIYRHRRNLTPLVPVAVQANTIQPLLDAMAELDAKIFEVYTEMASLDAGKEKNAGRAEWKALEQQRDALTKKLPEHDRAYGVREGEPRDAALHIKGDPEQLGAGVPRGFLQILGGQQVSRKGEHSGRRELAQWLTDPQNPLTARVIVNRIWLHHFGRGIVATPDDFGTRGDPPSHPELLDHLASQLIQSGWSLKALHRGLVLSQTYRMVSDERIEDLQRDPENRRLSRFNRRKLDAEELRDALLFISGALDDSRGGPHSFLPELEWRYTQHKPFVDDFPTRRRSVYLMQQRIRQQPFLSVFDGADTNVATGLRKPSTTPLQALFMMNNELVHEQAALLAQRLITPGADGIGDRVAIGHAYEALFARSPDEDEIRDGVEYLAELRAMSDGAWSAWASYLRVLLSSNEFSFVD